MYYIITSPIEVVFFSLDLNIIATVTRIQQTLFWKGASWNEDDDGGGGG